MLYYLLFRFKPGGEVSWLEKDLDHTVKRKKERRARKERKAKRRSRLEIVLDAFICIYFYETVIQ